MSDICVDSSFLIGLYDETDERHERATDYFLRYFPKSNNRLIIPWPIVYEAVSTQMVKKRNRKGMVRLEKDWVLLSSQSQLDLLSDLPFREGVVNECFDELRKPPVHYRELSAVDRVIRRILSDSNIQISAFLTFNPKDFVDVCKVFRREVLS
jgi:predicted nucleic acid-binding protein